MLLWLLFARHLQQRMLAARGRKVNRKGQGGTSEAGAEICWGLSARAQAARPLAKEEENRA
jgi:hypothetical protein